MFSFVFHLFADADLHIHISRIWILLFLDSKLRYLLLVYESVRHCEISSTQLLGLEEDKLIFGIAFGQSIGAYLYYII